jgi:signal transduction histidine kinase
MRFSTRLAKIIFVVTMLVLLVIASMLYLQVNDLVQANKMVNHTNEVQLKLTELLTYTKDAESAQRGYLLTKDSLFLQNYPSAFEGANDRIDRLRELTEDNRKQEANLKKLDSLVQIRFNSFNTTIKAFSSDTSITNKRQILLKEKSLMDSIRRQANAMSNIETREMGDRLSSQRKHAFLAPIVTVVLIFVTIGVLLLAYYRIILDLRRSENFLQQLQNLNKELIEKNRQLQQTNEELDSFNYISSHDLQEPVRKIRTFISMIDETNSHNISEKTRHIFQRIELSAIRIQELLHDLLSYSQVSKKEEDFFEVNLNSILEKATSSLEEKIQKTNAQISYTTLPTLGGNSFQLEKLFEQLISNALKYKKQNARPEIVINSEMVHKEELKDGTELIADLYHKITFRDNGIGFDQSYENKVFELFAQLNPDKENPGTGIGLTICKKVVQNHNGFIKVESKPNDGTSFFIYLPA